MTLLDQGTTPLDLPTPSLVIDRAVLERNLDEVAALAAQHGVELLPHAKTHRMADLGRLQLERGAHGLTVAKVGEAERFADAGATRLFVAYPLVGEAVAYRVLALADRAELAVGVDSVEGAASLGAVFAAAGRELTVVLAVDSGLGREGVEPAAALDVARGIQAVEGVELAGIFTHEGSVYGSLPGEVAAASRDVAGRMVALADELRAGGIPIRVVSLGSSASVRDVIGVPGVTQVRPGIYAVNDLGQVALGTASLGSTAIRVHATVVSRGGADRGCIDAGSKALGADLLPASALREQYPGYGLLVGHPGWVIDKLSEEHGWLRWIGGGEPSPLPVGTRVEIVPNHACVVFSALRRASVVQGGAVVATWDGFGPGSST
ncbi:MAG: alanine racemase [Actinomycetota bacterium]|nr:alanine racemase [Actinomycetota bacterium]